MFDIVRRSFVLVTEDELKPQRWCTSPFFETKGAKGSGTVLSKDAMFCFRPNPIPSVCAFSCTPADLSFPPGTLPDFLTTQSEKPYTAATLNLVAQGDRGLFSGQWRALSCACKACLLDDGSDCTSRGSHFEPLPWERYTVSRAPAVPQARANAFIAMMTDTLLAKLPDAVSLEQFANSTGEFIRNKLGRFRSVLKAKQYVLKRAVNNKKDNWVERAILAVAAQSSESQRRSALSRVKEKAETIGWTLPVGRSWEQFVSSCIVSN